MQRPPMKTTLLVGTSILAIALVGVLVLSRREETRSVPTLPRARTPEHAPTDDEPLVAPPLERVLVSTPRRSVEPRPSEEPRTDEGPDPLDLERRYGELSADELLAVAEVVARKMGELAETLFERKEAIGDYERVGPMPNDEYPTDPDVARALEEACDQRREPAPIVRMVAEAIPETDEQYVKVFKVYPEEDPRLLSLAKQHRWLTDRAKESP